MNKEVKVGSPPRMRGKVIGGFGVLVQIGITPACAGKSALCVNGGARSRDHPRMCGEKTAREFITYLIQGSPPRMRGKVIDLCEEKGIDGITPAYAGKRDSLPRDSTPPGDHPRVCGEKKAELTPDELSRGSPPRMRGKVHVSPGQVGGVGITPACAGKRTKHTAARWARRDHPRVCGEKPNRIVWEHWKEGSPPRMRGKAEPDCVGALEGGITPAYAGKSVKVNEPDCLPRDHPRVCGEKRLRAAPSHPITGSPPRMRGKVPQPGVEGCRLGITPAYAGKSQTAGCRTAAPEDHPRVCGEKTSSNVPERKNPGSPPRMQGKGCPLLFRYYFIGITPACAGKSSWCGSHPPASGDHPRVCGEKVIQVVPPAPQVGSPPRVRGKVTPHHRVANDRGITPACAGKSQQGNRLMSWVWDHPRVCGEKRWKRRTSSCMAGSPPRMRGKVLAALMPTNALGITPAYAGKSTCLILFDTLL